MARSPIVNVVQAGGPASPNFCKHSAQNQASSGMPDRDTIRGNNRPRTRADGRGEQERRLESAFTAQGVGRHDRDEEQRTHL
jgi:hypothetical protein